MSITKENSFIVISTSKGAVKVDCRDFSYISYTGRVVKRLPKVVADEYNLNSMSVHNIERRILDRIHDLSKTSERNYAIDLLKVYEKYLSGNNIDLINGLCDYDIAREIPKGFLQWCRDNDRKADNDALNEYDTIQYIKTLNDLDKKFYEYLNHKRINLRVIRKLNLVSVFRQIFNTTRKSGDIWCVYEDVRALIDKLTRVDKTFTEQEIKSVLDTNRDFRHNIDILDNYINRERNNKILENENKYREIETLSNDDYTIIVPKSMEDFTKEGKMQNNCVGYYYHDSIAEGRNFIYFIRKKENPKRSYITCRYSFSVEETCEYRTVNNNGVGDEKAIELIHTVDKMVKEIMSRI